MASYQVRSADELGAVIADRRLASELSQAELAEQAGLSRTYVTKIESGRTSSVTEHAFRLLRRLGATITITFDES
jgi:HTH-type transcriptional regulator / antitoxin HipB